MSEADRPDFSSDSDFGVRILSAKREIFAMKMCLCPARRVHFSPRRTSPTSTSVNNTLSIDMQPLPETVGISRFYAVALRPQPNWLSSAESASGLQGFKPSTDFVIKRASDNRSENDAGRKRGGLLNVRSGRLDQAGLRDCPTYVTPVTAAARKSAGPKL